MEAGDTGPVPSAACPCGAMEIDEIAGNPEERNACISQ
jgi:hypothetical protein